MKKAICVLACVIALMLTGCQGQGDLTNNTPPVHSSNVGEKPPDSDSPTSSTGHSTGFPNPDGDPGEVDTSGFQREMNVHHPFRINTACKTENGYYFEYSWFLYFMDAASGEMIVVCSKPECGHNSKDCNAYIQANLLSYYQGKLYYVTTAYLDADYHSIDTLCSMNLDGTSHTDLQKVRIDLTTPRAGCADPLLINGTVYFMEADHSIYRMALGQDVSKATLLLEENIPEKMANAQAFTSNTDWKFWADGGDVCAMCHVFTSSGEYVDILYSLGENRLGSREIWRSSQAGVSGQRDNISSWYILNGHLYYYFSGFDLWDIDLNTGEAAALVNLAGTIKSGAAVFTDRCVIILDDQPQTNSAGLYRQGGKNISVYDYSGNLLKSVDLSFVYKEYPNTHHCELIFADGNTVFLQGYIGMDNGMTSHLYQIDWESGTAREINSWPASDVPYDDAVKEFVI